MAMTMFDIHIDFKTTLDATKGSIKHQACTTVTF